MGVIAIASQGPQDWAKLLAKPTLHWRKGYSAMTLAACWEAAYGALPPEIARALDASGHADLAHLEPLVILPEYKVALPGGARASQTDVMVVARGANGLVVIAVEGKVDEPLGPTLGEKRKNATTGQDERLTFLHKKLGFTAPLPDELRYQLLHRTVSAVLVAEQFMATSAVMLVHSFSPTGMWFDDYAAFAKAMGCTPGPDRVGAASAASSPRLYLGWVGGDRRYRSVDFPL